MEMYNDLVGNSDIRPKKVTKSMLDILK
jgi:hypothetical protein